jgi:cytochrome oxidase assembly protein ShyY1
VYRFLITRRWLGYAALTLAAAAVMVLLGFWQLDRFHLRTAINNRIDAGASGTAVPLTEVMTTPAGPAGSIGPAPPESVRWTRVEVSGRYDRGREVLVRGRTVDGSVGFEVLTPLMLTDGGAVLVDRGWVAPADGGALVAPSVPAAPGGAVTVVGRLRPPESRGTKPELIAGHLETRRITPHSIATVLPYPLYDAYVGVDETATGLTPVPPEKENALQNGGYVLQWWLFAAGALFGFGYLARREARGPNDLADAHELDDADHETSNN